MRSGRFRPGDRLPSEAELVARFGMSRITVGRALRDLQAAGLVERRAGSGTFVTAPRAAAQLTFGLLIPDLGETEIFEPLCRGMMTSPLARAHALIWGSASGGTRKAERAWDLCRQFIDRGVDGVFFAPLELAPADAESNLRIVRALDEAGLPVVLLDRTWVPYPAPSPCDLVGLDNRAAGYLITEHLLRLGCRRLAFVGLEHAASTVDAREAGYREALFRWDAPVDRVLAQRLDPDDHARVLALMQAARPEGVVCANDRTAGRLMHTLRRLGYEVPRDVRLVGIDDVGYASLLPVPLTTLRQPTEELGDVALLTMLDRITRPDLPPREVHLQGRLIVRESCGSSAEARLGASAAASGA
jgi:DNA-binding LacI/PurR family transcriptional regulator